VAPLVSDSECNGRINGGRCFNSCGPGCMAIDPDGIAFVNFPNQIAHSFAESKGHSF
jgi:hypothetical protein